MNYRIRLLHVRTIVCTVLYCNAPFFPSTVEEDVSSLVSFSPQLLVEACVRCLRIIVANYEGSHVMPEAMSAKYRMCTDLANSIKVTKIVGVGGSESGLAM